MKRKVIIDCDPGIDDSLALIYAIQHPDLEVVALTIVAGNVPVDLGVENAFKILEKTLNGCKNYKLILNKALKLR